MTPDMFERDGFLIVRAWSVGTEVVPQRRPSGRLDWPSEHEPAVFKWKILAEFERQRFAGKRYANDLYEDMTFAEYTAIWFNDLRMHPWVDGIVPMAQRQPIRKHLLELRRLLLTYPLGKHLWFSVPSAEYSHIFADGLLRHVNAVLFRGFPREFSFRYEQPTLVTSKVSAGGELFKKIKECLLDNRGKRVWPPVGYAAYAKSKGYPVSTA